VASRTSLDVEWHYEGLKLLVANEILVVCSFCQSVAWPIGAVEGQQHWIRPEACHHSVGSTARAVSHGICPDCYNAVVNPKNDSISRV
jgi:hypothetical protein